MANAWEQVDSIASESLMHLEDSLIISNLCARDKSSDFNKTANGYAVGDTVRIKTRPDFEAREFAGQIEIQEIRESKRSMSIEKHFDVSVQLTAKEKALDFESFVDQVVNPAIYRLAEKVDTYVGTKILEAHGAYYSDNLFATRGDMALARREANYQQLNAEGRYCLIDGDLEAKLLGLDYFGQYDQRGDAGVASFQEASLGRAMKMSFFSAENFPTTSISSVGNGTSITNNGTAVNGVFPNNKIGDMALVIDALTGTLEAGTRIKIAGMRRPLVVSAQTTAGATSVPLVDPITEIVPDNAALTVVASGQSNINVQGAIFDNDSLAVAMPVLDLPSDKRASSMNNNGFSIRVVAGYDMKTKVDTMSFDCLVGAKAYDPRRITLLGEY